VSRPDGDVEGLGDPIERHVEVVVQDHHRAMIKGQAAKAALELIAIDDRALVALHGRLVRRHQPEVGRPATLLPTLGIAGVHEEPVRPGIEACRVAKLRKSLPDGEQRLLRRVLGEIDVAQDPARATARNRSAISAAIRAKAPLSPCWARITRSVFMPLPQ
jgi:hypothetical protein